ncbi:hypothetical protein F2P81_025312 [Scophthalmus maximus]|uniref:Uncharacterized protein n=1 Tax=Scophthalmus maximus TaxID=52904 RepID=A0A6A4RQX8_SCOMX|nr:hypothetical protein F2P81_025312 [Scophthalmus maximus]
MQIMEAAKCEERSLQTCNGHEAPVKLLEQDLHNVYDKDVSLFLSLIEPAATTEPLAVGGGGGGGSGGHQDANDDDDVDEDGAKTLTAASEREFERANRGIANDIIYYEEIPEVPEAQLKLS